MQVPLKNLHPGQGCIFCGSLDRPPRAQVICLYQRPKAGSVKDAFKKQNQKENQDGEAVYLHFSALADAKGREDIGADVAFAVRAGDG
jgi:hypothetical protein